MSGIRLELANPEGVQDYVEKHLAPIATELHRIVNELMEPGSSSTEDYATDMIPLPSAQRNFARLCKYLHVEPKHVTFDGSEYFSIPKELLRAKQAKVKMTAVVYADNNYKLNPVYFRLVDDGGGLIAGSEFETDSMQPVTISRTLQFADSPGAIRPTKANYFMEARSSSDRTQPVCRRFSLSFVYI